MKRGRLTDYDEILSRGGSVLLHVCCAPCMSAGIGELASHMNVTAYFYNPNITVRSEYVRRLDNVKKLIEALGLNIPVIDGGYSPETYYSCVGAERGGKEGGEKCRLCLAARIDAAVKECARIGADYCATTLTASPLKDADFINETGRKSAGKYGVKWLPTDFKKRGGCVNIKRLCEKFGIYRQHYCGCTPPRLTVAVTGGIASGKSRFVGMLEALGAYTIDADKVTKELQTPGHKVYDDILSAFPGCITDGALDRKKLASEVFADAGRLRQLESIVHPAVKEEISRLVSQSASPITVLEIPLLFESGMRSYADITVTVSAPSDERARRAALRNGMTAEMFAEVCRSQWTDAMREREADIVVVNDGNVSSLEEKAKELYGEWMRIINRA